MVKKNEICKKMNGTGNSSTEQVNPGPNANATWSLTCGPSLPIGRSVCLHWNSVETWTQKEEGGREMGKKARDSGEVTQN